MTAPPLPITPPVLVAGQRMRKRVSPVESLRGGGGGLKVMDEGGPEDGGWWWRRLVVVGVGGSGMSTTAEWSKGRFGTKEASIESLLLFSCARDGLQF